MALPLLSQRSNRRYPGHFKPPTPQPPSKTRKPPDANAERHIRTNPPKPLVPKHPSLQLASPLCQLPQDIIQIIAQALPAAAQAALALTCHGFWANRDDAAIRHVNSSQLNRAAFLTALDDNSGFLRCSACVTTHPLRGHEAEDVPMGLKLSGEGKCAERMGEVRVCAHYTLQYRVLLLVLRAERLGGGYGVPVGGLEHACKVYPWHGQECEVETHVTGRVVHGRLLLRLGYRVRVDLGETSWESQVMELLRRPVRSQPLIQGWKAMALRRLKRHHTSSNSCRPAVNVGCIHSHTCLPHFAVAAIRAYAEQIQELPDHRPWENRELNRPTVENWRQIHQCRYCATDFSVRVSLTDEPRQCLLHIVAYKDLGSNLPHTSALWAAATHPFGYVLDRSKALPYGNRSMRAVFAPLEHGGR